MPLLAPKEQPDETAGPGADLPENLRGGASHNFSFAIGSITLQDADPIDLISPGVTVVVGGNNTGKSTLLKQIHGRLSKETVGPPRLLTDISLEKNGQPKDLAAWLLENADLTYQPPRGLVFARPGASDLPPGLTESFWARSAMASLADFLSNYADARTRSRWTEPVDRKEDLTDPPTHPIHRFEVSEELRDELCRISQDAFQQTLTIDRLSGKISFRVGQTLGASPPIDCPTQKYQDELAALPRLDAQGDGMVFMLGALIPIIAGVFPVILLDEPEAFLHPPQAVRMGRALVELASKRKIQLVVATHDINILRGMLSNSNGGLQVVRLSRTGNNTHATTLSADQVREISQDKVLRYTRVLDGLFHRLVVLCENERDCHFYQASLEALNGQDPDTIPADDVLFVPTHGKGNMARIARALKDTGVRIVASPDLDMLRNAGEMKNLVQSLGGVWGERLIELHRRATHQFQRSPSRPLNKDILPSIQSILLEAPDVSLDADRRKRINEALRLTSPWEQLKREGVSCMTQDRAATSELIQELDKLGCVLVQVGELERFAPAAATSSKDAWLREALEQGAQCSDSARAHVQRLIGNTG